MKIPANTPSVSPIGQRDTAHRSSHVETPPRFVRSEQSAVPQDQGRLGDLTRRLFRREGAPVFYEGVGGRPLEFRHGHQLLPANIVQGRLPVEFHGPQSNGLPPAHLYQAGNQPPRVPSPPPGIYSQNMVGWENAIPAAPGPYLEPVPPNQAAGNGAAAIPHTPLGRR